MFERNWFIRKFIYLKIIGTFNIRTVDFVYDSPPQTLDLNPQTIIIPRYF